VCVCVCLSVCIADYSVHTRLANSDTSPVDVDKSASISMGFVSAVSCKQR